MSEVVSRCLPHRQLWVSNLSKVATQWLEVDSNLRPSGYKALNIPLHHRVPLTADRKVQVCQLPLRPKRGFGLLGGAVRSLAIRGQHALWLLNRWKAGFDQTAMNQIVYGGVSGYATKSQRAREAV